MTEPHGRHRRQDDAAAPPVLTPGAEDVLGAPHRRRWQATHSREHSTRSPWNRRRDRVLAAVIAVCCLVAGGTVWAFSDARATTLQTATPAPPLPPTPAEVPGSLTEIWRAPSPGTPVPVGVERAAVTAEGTAVLGRDPLTGEVRWRYARGAELCTVSSAWSKVLAVHRKDGDCSEVTQLDPATGERTAQRNSNAGPDTRLVSDCRYTDPQASELSCSNVTATGSRLLNTWRDDLVRTVEYGQVPALIHADRQPRTGCTYSSVAAAPELVGVLEQCPADPADRLTVYDAVPEDWDKPEPVYSVVVGGPKAKLVALTEEAAAVALPDKRLLVLYDDRGQRRATYPLEVPPEDLAGAPPGMVVPTERGTEGTYWFTGSATMALAEPDLTPRWTLPTTLGPGTMFAGQYVLPVPGGLAVLDQRTGTTIRTIGVDRGSYSGPIRLDAIGPVLLEQRGDTVVALR